jgi:hypothetical protein
MEVGNRKYILDVFQNSLCKSYQDYCHKHSMPESQLGLIGYLIDRDLFAAKSIRDHAVQVLYQEMSKETNRNKTQVVQLIAHRFNLSERAVWGALKGW